MAHKVQAICLTAQKSRPRIECSSFYSKEKNRILNIYNFKVYCMYAIQSVFIHRLAIPHITIFNIFHILAIIYTLQEVFKYSGLFKHQNCSLRKTRQKPFITWTEKEANFSKQICLPLFPPIARIRARTLASRTLHLIIHPQFVSYYFTRI